MALEDPECPDPDCVAEEGGGGGGALVMDAIMRPRIQWCQGHESRPQSAGRANFRAGDFTFAPTGGRSGGGHAVTVANEAGTGQYDCLEWNTFDNNGELPLQRGGTFAFDLAELAEIPEDGLVIYAIGQNGDEAHPGFAPQISVHVLTDRTLQLFGFHRVAGVVEYSALAAPSTLVLPAAGWFQGELQAGLSGLNPTGGFALLNVHIDGTSEPIGELVFNLVGISLEGGELMDVAWGSQAECFWPATDKPGVSGLKVDDITVYDSGGSVKRFLLDTRILALRPNGAGDATPGRVSWDSRETISLGGSAGDINVGVLTEYGDPDHWRNLVDNDRPDDEQLHALGWAIVDRGATVCYGRVNTAPDWIIGPVDPPAYPDLLGDGGDPTNPDCYTGGGTFDIDAENAIKRLTIDGEDTEFVTVGHDRTDVAAVEGLQPFVRRGMRWVIAAITQTNIGGLAAGLINMVSPISLYDDLFSNYPSVGNRADLRWVVRRNGVDVESQIISEGSRGKIAQFWSTNPGYEITNIPTVPGGSTPSVIAGHGSFVDKRPGDGLPFEPDDLPIVQLGVHGDLTVYDALGGVPEHRFAMIDLCELGAEVPYHPVATIPEEHEPFPPRAFFVVESADHDTGHLSIRDESLDWDGTVVSVVVDWGDGSPTESMTVGGTIAHDYAVPGPFTVSILVTDNDGLTDTYDEVVHDFDNEEPVAVWTFEVDGGDPLLVHFTDLSTDDGVVVGWLWDFGDGNTSTDQNPDHTYAAPGVYTVTLVVTDDGTPPLDSTNDSSGDVDLSASGPACGLSAGILADTAWYQGDDLLGGNAPLPNPVNTAGFDAYYTGSSQFREQYDTAYAAAGVDHRITTYEGAQALEMDFGAGHFGAGWDAYYYDDAHPGSETVAPFFGGYRGLWARLIWAGESGVMSDAGATGFGQGLTLMAFPLQFGFGEVALRLRGGNVYLDVDEGSGIGGHQTPFLVCSESVFLARVSGYGELGVNVEMENSGDRSFRVKVWAGDECSLTGVSPLVNEVFTPTGAGDNGVADFTSFFNANFTPSGAIKHAWWRLWEQVPSSKQPTIGVANPYGYALS